MLLAQLRDASDALELLAAYPLLMILENLTNSQRKLQFSEDFGTSSDLMAFAHGAQPKKKSVPKRAAPAINRPSVPHPPKRAAPAFAGFHF